MAADGRIISGITSASFTTANAHVADVTAPQQRARSYGVIGAAFGLFIGRHAPMHLPGAPFLIAAVLLVAAVLIAWHYARAPADARVARARAE